MAHLLHLDASARSESISRELGQDFVAHWKNAQADGTVTYRDLVRDPVPPVDEARVRLSTLSGQNGVRDLAAMDEVVAATPELAGAWAATRPLIEQFIAADTLLLGAPMYNFSIPAALKTWIDRVTLPWLPVAGKSVVVLSARGGAYGPGTPREPFDYQETYLRAYFSALKIENVEFVHSEFTHAPVMPFLAQFRDQQKASHTAALETVEALATRVAAGSVSS
ncbi:NAD(P)H-dependent oxidoreductase [Actinoplanes sp. NPDC023936]|uniref:FMN-dependent NADH-azoreductase n=1 Tax=Actinoplanes sp. NPDC023936 TaxID=3154910 RepID=UPI0033D961BE